MAPTVWSILLCSIEKRSSDAISRGKATDNARQDNAEFYSKTSYQKGALLEGPPSFVPGSSSACFGREGSQAETCHEGERSMQRDGSEKRTMMQDSARRQSITTDRFCLKGLDASKRVVEGSKFPAKMLPLSFPPSRKDRGSWRERRPSWGLCIVLGDIPISKTLGFVAGSQSISLQGENMRISCRCVMGKGMALKCCHG